MDWVQLLNNNRIHGISKEDKNSIDPRSEYEKDVQRIFFAYPFRRLQNKTQVIPTPVFDFIHTRLTHSLEVGSVGNILGRIVGKVIIQRHKDFNKYCLSTGITETDIGAIIQAASLAHDIGNPPFGHSGEGSISDYFNLLVNEDTYRPYFFTKEDDPSKFADYNISGLTKKHWYDFSKFDGNAMGFRIINNKHYSGFNLTYATLATYSKYPRESYINSSLIDPLDDKKRVLLRNEDARASQKKFGFFQSEKELFSKIANSTTGVGLIPLGDDDNLSWCRHPLAFLVEAADDVCNMLVDFEDGFRLGRFKFEEVREVLNDVVDLDLTSHKVYRNLADQKEKVGYLKNKALFNIINDIAHIFIDNESNILSGNYDKPLIEDSKYINTKDTISKFLKEKLFVFRPILELETVGFEVIGGLMGLFIMAVTEDSNLSPKHREKIIQLIPKQFQLTKHEDRIQKNFYLKILKIIDFVSGMTDTYAIQLFRSLKGIDIPKIQNIV